MIKIRLGKGARRTCPLKTTKQQKTVIDRGKTHSKMLESVIRSKLRLKAKGDRGLQPFWRGERLNLSHGKLVLGQCLPSWKQVYVESFLTLGAIVLTWHGCEHFLAVLHLATWQAGVQSPFIDAILQATEQTRCLRCFLDELSAVSVHGSQQGLLQDAQSSGHQNALTKHFESGENLLTCTKMQEQSWYTSSLVQAQLFLDEKLLVNRCICKETPLFSSTVEPSG